MRALLERLSMRAKMATIGVLALAAAAVPTALHMKLELDNWSMARHELAGLAPAHTVQALQRLTQQHRGLSNGVLSGNKAAEPDRAQAASALLAAHQAAERAAAGLADTSLQRRVAAQGPQVKALVDSVAGGTLKPAESFAQHTALVNEQTRLLYDIAVSQQLVLHPEPGGYFLQDAALRQLPPLVEALARLRGTGMGLLARREATATERAQLAGLVAQARSQAFAVGQALTLAQQGHPALKAQLSKAVGDIDARLQDGLAYAESAVVQPETLAEPPAQWWQRTTALIDQLYGVADLANKALDDELVAYAAERRNQLLVGGAGMTLLMGVCLLVIVSVARQMTAAMGQAVDMAEAVAQGDLSRRASVSGQDEAARMLTALGAMTTRLAATVGQVRDNATQVATASQQIAQGNLDLSSRTEQQASALQQTAATIEELSSTVTQTADNARQAAQLAQAARDVAARGGTAVDQVVATMNEISSSSRKIADIIGTIDGIAFQTNILALNAAVEAARAGEQGRGFAVVASEVRSLAQRSSTAAREIRGLIGGSVDRMEAGAGQADAAGATMQEILQAIDRVSTLMASISTAAVEQSNGVTQVDQAIGEIDRATQQNAALVEESAAAADSLHRQAEALQQAVGAFRIGEGRAAVTAG